jgi:hypothetical protein
LVRLSVAREKFPHTIPFALEGETFDVGSDTGSGVNDKDYEPPFHFTGKLDKLTVRLAPEQVTKAERKAMRERVARAKD